MNAQKWLAMACFALTSPHAVAAEVYMCEIVDGESSQLVAAANLDVIVSPGFRLVTRSDERAHTLDFKLFRKANPDSTRFPPQLHFAATIEEGPNARPIILPVGRLTLDCKNQNTDALTWTLLTLKQAGKSQGGLGEKVDEDVIGLKQNTTVNSQIGLGSQPPENISKQSAQ